MDRSGRRHKQHVSNSFHHVMMRGNNRQKIFFGEEYFEYFITLISEAVSKFDFKIVAFCLMTNHIHLVIHIHETPLSEIIKNISYRYVRWVHKKLKRIGHLFQGRYLSIPIQDETYLINVIRYVHLNPVDAKMARFPHEYPWSSHKYYLFQNCPEWISLTIALKTISEKTNMTYHDFIINDPDRDAWRPHYRVSGAGELILLDSVARDHQISMSNLTESVDSLDLTTVVVIVSQKLNISIDDLKLPARTRCLANARGLIAFYAIKYANTTLVELGKLFQRTPMAISKIHSKIKASPEKYFSDELLLSISQALEG